jgi:hypothetical protein
MATGFWPLTSYLHLATGDWLNRFVRHSEKASNQEPVTSSQRPAASSQEQGARYGRSDATNR